MQIIDVLQCRLFIISSLTQCSPLTLRYAMQPTDLAVAGCGVCMMLPGTNAFLSHQTVFHSPIVPVSEEKLAPIL